jgi:hypothetical protein
LFSGIAVRSVSAAGTAVANTPLIPLKSSRPDRPRRTSRTAVAVRALLAHRGNANAERVEVLIASGIDNQRGGAARRVGRERGRQPRRGELHEREAGPSKKDQRRGVAVRAHQLLTGHLEQPGRNISRRGQHDQARRLRERVRRENTCGQHGRQE